MSDLDNPTRAITCGKRSSAKAAPAVMLAPPVPRSVAAVSAGCPGRHTAWCQWCRFPAGRHRRSEEHTSELQSLMRNSYAVFCLKKTHLYQITYGNNKLRTLFT